MGSLNKVQLIGNLGRDAEVRYTAGGAAVASFSIATTEKWRDKNGDQKEKTEWHRVVLWGKRAEALSAYLTKGKTIYVEGKLTTRKWEQNGEKKYSTEIKADDIVLLGGGGGQRSGGRQEAYRSDERDYDEPEPVGVGGGAVTDDDIPF